MTISYDRDEDILFLRFNEEPVTRDISYGWNINAAMTEKGIGQITVVDAKSAGLLPISLPKEISELIELEA